MSSYITLAQLKEATGFPTPYTDITDDGALNSCIVRSSAHVDEYLRTNRPGYVGFAASSNAHSASLGSNTRSYDGSGDDTLFIDDAASVASVTVDDVVVTSTAYTAWPYNEMPKRALIFNAPTTSVHGLTTDRWTRGTGNVDVTAYFGLPTVPDEIAAVTLAVALVLWRRNQSREYAGSSQALTSQRFSGGSGRVYQTIVDPEIMACLSTLDAGWAVPGVWGG